MDFSSISPVCVSLQKGTPGPPQPQRQRAPPAMTPREAEARPKLQHGLKSEGGVQTIEGWGVEERKGVSVALVGDAFTHCRPVWSCCSPDARLLLGIRTRGAALSSADRFIILIRLERTEVRGRERTQSIYNTWTVLLPETEQCVQGAWS